VRIGVSLGKKFTGGTFCQGRVEPSAVEEEEVTIAVVVVV